jgi:NAD(P)-dependent dehydrogenase (short-subunit alcohol dehydrogenase family)
MNKNQKILLGSAATVFAGIGIYKYISTQQNGKNGTAEIWTTADIPDLTGKVIIVTGANSGIGYEAAKEFTRKGAQTILACRNMEKAETALAQIRDEIPDAQAEIMQLDLSRLDSVRAFVDTFKAKYDRLDVLLNNAGIMMVPYGTTEDGFERQFGTNHLGHFALTGMLIDLLSNTPDSRVVNVSSNGHRQGKMDFDNLMYVNGNGYSPMQAYGRTKLANLLFTYELQRRLEDQKLDVISVAAHPGISETNLGAHLQDKLAFKMLRPIFERIGQSAAMGALPSIRAAVDSEVAGGEYFGPGGTMEMNGYPVLVPSSKASHNLEDAKKLWKVSQQLTSVEYL